MKKRVLNYISGLGDFKEIPDNEIPVLSYHKLWETPVTVNNTWGYSKVDKNWKSAETIIRKLVKVTGKGGNLLLNIGPDSLGDVPEECEKVLQQVGEWLKINGESIYDTETVPDFSYEMRFGGITKNTVSACLGVSGISVRNYSCGVEIKSETSDSSCRR